MTLEEHARAIEAAIRAAADDGCHLDNGEGEPLRTVELTRYDGVENELVEWDAIVVPAHPFDEE